MQFSVIIPCYNCAATLAETVESIRVSGLYDYEIILIDDGSVDGTAALCDTLCAENAAIRCVHQSNAGVSAARNRGIDEAKGDYIWFVDADDTVDAGAMSAAAEIAVTQQPDMLIFGMSFDYYHRGRRYRRDDLLPPCEGLLSRNVLLEHFRAFYDCNALTPVWNKLYRRSVLAAPGVRFHEDMILMEDFLFVLELLPHCESIYSLPKAIYQYRQAEDERGAYRRLQRITDLAAYMQPFEAALARLAVPDREALVAGFYGMLLRQKLYYAPLRDIRAALAVHRSGPYAACMQDGAVALCLRNTKSRLRHRAAVAAKSAGVYRR